MEYIISKEKLTSIIFDDEKNELSINWWTGGHEGAVCGIVVKAELVDKKISPYRAPVIEHDPNYNNSF